MPVRAEPVEVRTGCTGYDARDLKRSTRQNRRITLPDNAEKVAPARTANVQLDMARVKAKPARSARPLAGDGSGVKGADRA